MWAGIREKENASKGIPFTAPAQFPGTYWCATATCELGLMEQVLEGQTEELAECITVGNLEELSRLGRRLRRLQYMICVRGPNTLHCPEHY